MGVTYKLKEEVVSFIISQRQANPLFSCRQLAESASQKFGLKLSKSSVHDVLKESGIITPRGRKPKDKFEIPQEKKQQIQSRLSQTKLLPKITPIEEPSRITKAPEKSEKFEISTEYENAGKIFLKAALLDLGIFSEENIKESDWNYYLTYCKGIKITLEDGRELFVEMPAPVERCVREAVDGLINNVRPAIVSKVSDKEIFKLCMEAQEGFKITNISIVDKNNHKIFEISYIVEFKREFMFKNVIFVENNNKIIAERVKTLFFTQGIENKEFIEEVLKLKGFDSINNANNIVTLLAPEDYVKSVALKEAAARINSMYLHDEDNRKIKVEIKNG